MMAAERRTAEEFAFGFDEPFEPLVFSRTRPVSGWLIDTSGEPIHGIRVIVTKCLRPRHVVRARRKRSRPDIGAAFPAIPAAESSGFYVNVPLRAGANRLLFQVQDARKCWRTFFNAEIKAVPLDFLLGLGLTNLHEHLRTRPQHRRRRSVASSNRRMRQVPVQDESAPVHLRRVIVYATAKSNLFIREVGELVVAGFTELGLEAELLLDQKPGLPVDDLLQIVLTPHEYYNLFLLESFSPREARELARNVVLLCTEQPETSWFRQNLRWAGYARAVADINALGVAAYRQLGIRTHYLALGFHEILASRDQQPLLERQVDITFLGSLTTRRDLFFSRHAAFFSRYNCHLRFVPLGFAKTESSRSYLSTAERNALLANSRILLNVHYSGQRYFEWHRMLLGFANGCCIISETCVGFGPLIPNQHFVMVEKDELIDACRFYLEHPDECARIARAGHDFVRDSLRQSHGCQKFLLDLRRNETSNFQMLAADVSDDPGPARLPLALDRSLNQAARRSLWKALGSDLRSISSHSHTTTAQPSSETPTTLTQSLIAVRSGVIEKRAAYHQRLQEQASRRKRGEKVWTLHDSEAFSGSQAPQISVIITLYNYEQFIEGCAEAIDRAAAQLSVPIEIVIVDDASTDGSLARAHTIQMGLDRPVRIVQKYLNTGLADARNVGTQIARAPYVFMMDADNLITPRALRLLLEEIERGQHAAAYSLLCRFRGSPENALGLLSYYDWDPEILVQSPYIDAMALFRRATLLELGGYDCTLSQIGWFGWEDYEMWLRFAARGFSVGFVPNTLCFYRHHDKSMSNTTNLFEEELVRVLQERYQSLVDRYPARKKIFGMHRHKLRALAEDDGANENNAPDARGNAGKEFRLKT
jgi:glycosyltransferase involved in cell wall biosynthesis